MKAFTEPLLELAEFETIQKIKYRNNGMIQIAGSTGSQKSHLAYALSQDSRRVLYIVGDEEKAKEVVEEYQFLDTEVFIILQKIFVLPCRYPWEISDQTENGSSKGVERG